MYNTYYLSCLGFEVLLGLKVKKDVLVPTANILKTVGKAEIYTEIGRMAKNDLLDLDEEGQKIIVKPEILNAFKQIAGSKRIIVINSHLKSGGAMCLYYYNAYVVVEMSATRPGMVKLTLLDSEHLGEYFNDVPWLIGEDIMKEELQETSEANSENGVFLNADFYAETETLAKKKLIAISENGQKRLLMRQNGRCNSSYEYSTERLLEIVGTFFKNS